jgi:hypothetical protein
MLTKLEYKDVEGIVISNILLLLLLLLLLLVVVVVVVVVVVCIGLLSQHVNKSRLELRM